MIEYTAIALLVLVALMIFPKKPAVVDVWANFLALAAGVVLACEVLLR